MPRLVHRLPAYQLHRASGQAVVKLSGQTFYLGVHGTDLSKQEYDRVCAEWMARGRVPARAAAEGTITVNMLLVAYLDHAEEIYAHHATSGELEGIRLMMRVMKRLYGGTPAVTFGPLALQIVREEFIKLGWSRKFINAQVNRLRRMFKWASSRELVTADVWHSLLTVDGLRKGRSTARETEKVKPVSRLHVAATLQHASKTISAMVMLQLLTGMRPGEVVIMRGCDIDTTGDAWVYRPSRHKTEHHDHDRIIPLGPQAQEIIRDFLKPDLSAFLFSPRETEVQRRAKLSEQRRLNGTPLSCGNRPGSNVKRSPRRAPGDRYNVANYRQAIVRAADRAFPPPPHLQQKQAGRRAEKLTEWRRRLGAEYWRELENWWDANRWHPNQLRHTAATELRKTFGLEAAQVILGHATLKVTEIYAEKNVQQAKDIMAKIG